jgi:small-conductance mechanosensitive channel
LGGKVSCLIKICHHNEGLKFCLDPNVCIFQLKVYQERKALAHALSDTKTAVKQLNKLVTVVLVVVTIVVWLLLMEIATTKVLVFLSSQLVLAAFMFGNTCKNIFEAIIFVFVMHPFDVGDRCVIDGIEVIYSSRV